MVSGGILRTSLMPKRILRCLSVAISRPSLVKGRRLGPSIRLVRFLKSITIPCSPNHCFPEASFFFGTTHTGALKGEFEFSMIPFSNISLTCLCISNLWISGGRYDLTLIGFPNVK